MTDLLTRNWRPRLVCLALAVMVWHLVRDRVANPPSGRSGLMPTLGRTP